MQLKTKFTFLFTVILGIGVLQLYSCQKIKDVFKVNVGVDNMAAEIIIPATGAGEGNASSFNVYLNLDSLINASSSKVNSSNIKEVRLTSCQLTLLSPPENQSLGDFSAASLQIWSNKNSTPTTMAQVTNNADAQVYTITLPLNSSIDLKNYFISANTFGFKLSWTARRAIGHPMQCNVLLKYNMVVGL